MTETLSGFDTQIDWIPFIAGIFTIALGLGVGTWLWRKVFLILVGLAYFIVIFGIPFVLISSHVLTTWQNMAIGCGILGLLIAVFFFPFVKLYEMSEAIKFMKKKFNITDAEIRRFTSGEKENI